MKERPILFSTPMVQAILEGRKTQTRRIVKIPDLIKSPERFEYTGNSTEFDIPRKAIPYDDRVYHQWRLTNNNSYSWVDCCPYGSIGDVLWVRETWQILIDNSDLKPRFAGYAYKADTTIWPDIKWKPSIFMPKEACRIRLEITDIRVERVQDISEADAIAEGIESIGTGKLGSPVAYRNYLSKGAKFKHSHIEGKDDYHRFSAADSYQSLWKSINGKGSWNNNPWVWVISFKKL